MTRPPARLALVVGITATLLALATAAEGQEAIEYRLSFPDPHTQYASVEAKYPTGGAEAIDLTLATWTPGSYLVREYSRNLEAVAASSLGGQSLPVRKTAKNRWRVEGITAGASKVRVTYRVYCREMSVRTNWVDEEFAMINGAPTFLTLLDTDGLTSANRRPHRVEIIPATGWQISMTGLPEVLGKAHTYLAPDYDTLVDCPIVIGNPVVHEFDVGGKKHYLVNQGESDVWDGPRSARDARRLVEENLGLWGQLPYAKYVFLNMITESGGGLEHKNSTLMMTSRWRTRTAKDYRGWLGLVSHEYFHTWNVKRLRPVELGPFDYENEVYTESLWVAEGITSYYDDLNLTRAGLATVKQYLEALSKTIEGVETTPGRHVRSLADASRDAWIKHYRRDENSPNTTISYYSKGSLIGWLLDMEIRRRTDGARSLDDAMRLAYERYSGDRGYTPEEFYACATDVAGSDMQPWFARNVEGTEELDYAPALAWLGLCFKDPDARKKPKENDTEPDDDGSSGDTDDDEEKPGWLGLATRDDDGRLRVQTVKRETPGYEAGFNVDDEILAIDEYRVTAKGWEDRKKRYRPGDQVTFLIARRDRLMTIAATFGEKPASLWKLQRDPKATDEQKARLGEWLASRVGTSD